MINEMYIDFIMINIKVMRTLINIRLRKANLVKSYQSNVREKSKRVKTKARSQKTEARGGNGKD
jgi:hypothetical protein